MAADGPVRVYFCSACGEMIGVQDHVRIRHEHFEEGWPEAKCRGGRYRIVEYTPTGRDLHEVDVSRQDMFNEGFRVGYERGRSDEEHGRQPPWSARTPALSCQQPPASGDPGEQSA